MAINYATGLSNYVDTQKLPLLRKLALAPQSTKYFHLMTGVVGDTNLNLLDTTISFLAGDACGWNASGGNDEFSAKKLAPGQITINKAYCDKKMQDYWNGWAVKVAANGKEGALPFEEEFTNAVKERVGSALEKALWQGDTTSSDANLNKFDGLVKQVSADASITELTSATSATIVDKVYKVYEAIADENLQGSEIFMSIANFRKLVHALGTSGNVGLIHYDPKVDGDLTIVLPNTDTKVHGVGGLSGINKIYAFVTEHVVYGCSMEDDVDQYDLWYSRDNQEYRLAINFVAGITYAFPTEVVVHN